MGGLLYKDFVTVCRIKKVNLLFMLAVSTLLFMMLRIVFPGNAGIMLENEAGEAVSLADTVFVMVFALFILTGMGIINSLSEKIIGVDEKNKIKVYLSVMPIQRETYIASKYLFIGIACYIILAIEYVWGTVCTGFCNPGAMFDLCQLMTSFLLVFILAVIFVASIELPMFLLLGREKAMYIKVAFLLAIAFIVIGYVLFGDLDRINTYVNISHIIEWAKMHRSGITVFQSMFPAIILGLYYLSYRLTCRLSYRMQM